MQTNKRGKSKKTDADLLALIRKALSPKPEKLIDELPNIDDLRRLAYMVPKFSFQITYTNGEFIFAANMVTKFAVRTDVDAWAAYDMLLRDIWEWTKQPGKQA